MESATAAAATTTTTITNKNDCGYVLYVDHQGHPAPLEESYHATATRCLSSAIINRGYPSTIRTVDSAYCPQCFTVYTEIGQYATTTSQPSSATSSTSSNNNSTNNTIGYYCTKATCKLCPICLSIASVQLVERSSSSDDNSTVVALYQCGNCDWSSDQCRLVTPLVTTSSENEGHEVTFGRIELARASNELTTSLNQMKHTFDEMYHQYWIQVTNSWIEETRRSSVSSSVVTTTTLTESNSKKNTPSRVDRIRSLTGTTSPQHHLLGKTHNRTNNNNLKSKQWSLEALEESLQTKKKKLSIQLRMMKTSQGILVEDNDNEDDEYDEEESNMTLQKRKGLQIQRISVKSIQPIYTRSSTNDTNNNNDDDNVPYVSYLHQLLNTPFIENTTSTPMSNQEEEDISAVVPTTGPTTTTSTTSLFLPLLIPLRLRTSRRCRKELNEGRPGILLKPKLNPLEGDSSLRTGQGQWYKKDCSAIAIVPRIDIVHCSQHSHNNDSSIKHIALLVKVSNPTLGTVRLRLMSSQYNGERVLFPDETSTKNDNKSDPTMETPQPQTTTMLQDLVVDTISSGVPTIVHAKVVSQSTAASSSISSEIVELLSAEDSIIELGSIRPRETPMEVKNWIPPPSTTSPLPTIRFIAQNASDAWFEYCTAYDRTSNSSSSSSSSSSDESIRLAIPIALQVEIGNGSWESSLIPPKPSATTIPMTTSSSSLDFVSFDVVLVV